MYRGNSVWCLDIVWCSQPHDIVLVGMRCTAKALLCLLQGGLMGLAQIAKSTSQVMSIAPKAKRNKNRHKTEQVCVYVVFVISDKDV